MKSKPLCAAIAIAGGIALSFPPVGAAGQDLEPYVQWEIERLERTYALLDSYARDIWPHWDDYLRYDVLVRFPNLVTLLVGPEKPPEGCEPIAGVLVHGRPAYLNRTKALPIAIDMPLFGGGGGGKSVTIKLKMTELTPPQMAAWKARAEREIDPELFGERCSEDQILVYVHEFFHCYQQSVAKMTDVQQDVDISELVPTAEGAAYAEIEGRCLMKALSEGDPAAMRRHLADWLAAYDARRAKMDAAFVASETLTTAHEGTATYSNLRMAQIVIERGYASLARPGGDPVFFGFRHAGSYVQRNLDEIEDVMAETFDTVGKCYDYGAYQCFLLDRVVPGWKEGFFESGKSLADLLRGALRLTDAERSAAAARLESLHGFEQLVAKHAAPLKKGQDALALVNARRGRTFVIDMAPLREYLPIRGRGESFQVGMDCVYPHGIDSAALGEILLTSPDTPIVRREIFRLEWVDTEVAPGRSAYSLDCLEKSGDICKNATLTTKGFVLKAPEMQVKESADGKEVTISILTKVPRRNRDQ